MISTDELIAFVDATEADGPILAQLEVGALAFIQTQTGRYFGPPASVDEFITGDGGRKLWLQDHVAEESDGSNVLVDERAQPGMAPRALVINTDFELRAQEKECYLARWNGVWRSGYDYTVTYQRGYVLGEEPADIRQLLLDLVASRWSLQGAEGLRNETMGGYSYTRFGDSDVDSVLGGWATIESWRRPVCA